MKKAVGISDDIFIRFLRKQSAVIGESSSGLFNQFAPRGFEGYQGKTENKEAGIDNNSTGKPDDLIV